jgi:hypothetical protein
VRIVHVRSGLDHLSEMRQGKAGYDSSGDVRPD